MEDLHPLSLEAKGDHLLVILSAHVGPTLVNLKGPEAKHQVSCQAPGAFSPSNLKSRE